MANFRSLGIAAFACAAFLVPGAASAQTTSSDFWFSPAQCNFALSLNSARVSSAERTCYFRSQMFGRAAYLTVSFWSSVAMLKHQVFTGADSTQFADQLGLRYSRVLAKNSAEFLASGWAHQDPRFRSSQVGDQNCTAAPLVGGANRLVHALVRVVWTVNEDTCAHQLSYGRFAGAFASSLTERAWLPERKAGWDHTMSSASVSLSSYAARSVWAEFLPDIRRMAAPHAGRFRSLAALKAPKKANPADSSSKL